MSIHDDRIHEDRRRELAAGLRALHQDQGVSTHHLAVRLGWSQSKVSRISRGATLPKPDEVEQWAHELSAPAEVRRHLVDLARKAGLQLTEWRREVAPGRRRVQAEIGRKEAGASVIRLFGMDVIPGLAQTQAYAEVMFKLGQHQVPDAEQADVEQDNEGAVIERLTRQEALGNSDKTFKLLCTETAFRRSLLPRDDMIEQIDRVLEVARLSNVEFGVIPFSAKETTHIYHGFAVLGDPAVDDDAIVLVETVTRGLTIRSTEEITGYAQHYDELAKIAITGDQLATFLQEVAVTSPWS
ncbi:helix-turn-helix transcriptional regulator [Kutzneria viridogrisea]|uniref:Transcriptional regulator with XRE-family HTH domain n=1 Tax=Kutzneria viridogrisea TaxID=47990 RepID=A0ABR6BZ24_9PSEU|nr:transcriptional regulator with XRE-family HTH domain [Kutzneria viridogrisea]